MFAWETVIQNTWRPLGIAMQTLSIPLSVIVLIAQIPTATHTIHKANPFLQFIE